jgi:hypothetical protein
MKNPQNILVDGEPNGIVPDRDFDVLPRQGANADLVLITNSN